MTTLKEALKEKLNKKELGYLITSYDMIGDIAIIQIPEELEHKEKTIAKTLLNLHKNINVVAKRVGIHKGTYRLQDVKILAGEKRKETIHKENGVRIKLNVEKVYFSPRLSTERMRIAQLINKPEKILVMFSGCAPYPLVIVKNSPAEKIIGIELNPIAHKYAQENIKLNKMSGRIKLIHGDVKEEVPQFKQKFDRILMPLPKTGEEFLPSALKAIKKEGIIHLYSFLDEEDIEPHKKEIKETIKNHNLKSKIVRAVQCGQYSPGSYRVCFDIKVL